MSSCSLRLKVPLRAVIRNGKSRAMHQRRKGFQDHLSWPLRLLRISACVGQSDSTDVIGVLAQMCLNIIGVQLNRLLQSVRRFLTRIGVDQPVGGH